MSESFDDDYYPISISIEAPVDDAFNLYGYPQLLPEEDEEVFLKDLGNLDDLLLGPSHYTPGSPFSEDSPASTYRSDSFSPSVFEALSLNSPSSPFFPSTTSSPWFSAGDLADEIQNATVSPKDIMGHTYGPSSPSSPPLTVTASQMEPLFEMDTDEAQSHELIALDELAREVPPSTLLGAQTMNLRIRIPVAPHSPQLPIPTLHSPLAPLSPTPSFCSPSSPSEFPSPCSPNVGCVSLEGRLSPSPLPSPSPSPQSAVGPTRHKHRSRSFSTSSSTPARHHPYKQEMPVAKGAGEVIDGANLKQIVSFLESFPQFANWDFGAKGLPPMVRGVVGSEKTRQASEHRRTTQEGSFFCIIPNCGSTVTKKHNLRHHIVSHFILHAFECDVCKQGFNHHCSLVRHMKKCGAGDAQAVQVAQSVKVNKRGKRAKRS